MASSSFGDSISRCTEKNDRVGGPSVPACYATTLSPVSAIAGARVGAQAVALIVERRARGGAWGNDAHALSLDDHGDLLDGGDRALRS
jgi:hypothetical protein